MEADGVVEGYSRSIEMHGLKYNKLIGRYVDNKGTSPTPPIHPQMFLFFFQLFCKMLVILKNDHFKVQTIDLLF